MRYTPVISFFFDESIERAARISELIENVKREDAQAEDDAVSGAKKEDVQ
jgi:hypothetical protein